MRVLFLLLAIQLLGVAWAKMAEPHQRRRATRSVRELPTAAFLVQQDDKQVLGVARGGAEKVAFHDTKVGQAVSKFFGFILLDKKKKEKEAEKKANNGLIKQAIPLLLIIVAIVLFVLKSSNGGGGDAPVPPPTS